MMLYMNLEFCRHHLEQTTDSNGFVKVFRGHDNTIHVGLDFATVSHGFFTMMLI